MTEQTKIPPNYVIQGNLISTALYSCSALERKIISVAISHIEKGFCYTKGERFATYGAQIPVATLLKKLHFSYCGKNIQIVQEAVDKLSSRQIKIKQGKEWYSFSWFLATHFNPNTNYIELAFSPLVALSILDLSKGYSKLDYIVIGNSKSQYSLGYYELAKSWIGMKGQHGNKSNQWFWTMTIEEIRDKFQLEDTEYIEVKNLIAWVVDKPIKSLNSINDEFQIEPIKQKEGRKTIGFKFLCTEIKTKHNNYNISQKPNEDLYFLQNNPLDCIVKNATETASSDFNKELNFFKTNHKEEFEILLSEKRKSNPLFRDNPESAEFSTFLELKNKYSKESFF